MLFSSGCLRTLPVDPAALGGQAVTSVVIAADGSQLTSLRAEQDRTPLAYAEIPALLVQAVVATEDRRFFDHKGVDARGIARAAVADIRSRRVAEGGSTITQQLVKNTIVTRERTIRRKIREASLAVGLEKSLTKEQILERYLNTVYFGQGTYGVGAAMRVYFGHGPQKVTVAEAALLAGLIRSPGSADPIRKPKAAKARRAAVLRDMVATGVITEQQQAAANRARLPRRVHRDDTHFPAAHAVADAVEELRADARLGETQADRDNAIFRGGLTIQLTIDPAHQRAAERAVAKTLSRRKDPAAGVAAVKPGDGAITAMVGGRDFFSRRDPVAKVNMARGGITKRQAGSTFKVFTLIAALEAGITPDDLFKAGRGVTLPRPGGRTWEIGTGEGSAAGKVTLREATEKSVNTAYARVLERIGDGNVDLGSQKVVEVAERLGVRGRDGSELRASPATTLGAQEVDPVQMAAAYATLASGGVYAEPYLVASVKDQSGAVILSNTPQPRRLVSEGVAAVANDVLQGVVTDGTGKRADIGRPQAGKTGTSSNYHDAWYVGYTPDFAAAVWVGVAKRQVAMTPRNGFRITVMGGTFPAVIWSRFVGSVLAGRPEARFQTVRMVEVEIDAERGCLADEWTPAADREKREYVAGTEPTKICPKPRARGSRPVPAVVGMELRDAVERIETAGFRVEIVLTPTSQPPGEVVGQAPEGGRSAPPGVVVRLFVSGAEGSVVTVPDIVGLDQPAALAALKAVGLRGSGIVTPSCTSGDVCADELRRTAGLVWRQDSAPGERTVRGATVRFAVQPERGNEPAPSPTSNPSPSATPAPSPTG